MSEQWERFSTRAQLRRRDASSRERLRGDGDANAPTAELQHFKPAACGSLSACITDLGRSEAMCSCACVIIPDHHSVQHLHVVTSNGWDGELHYLALFFPFCRLIVFPSTSLLLVPPSAASGGQRNMKLWAVNEWRLQSSSIYRITNTDTSGCLCHDPLCDDSHVLTVL